MTDQSATLRDRIRKLVDHPRFQNAILALILVNAVTLGMETSATIMERFGTLIQRFDQIVLAIFVLELVLRIWAHGGRFFRDPWGIFDFVVVAIALTPSTGQFAVLRALRVLRVLRILTIVPSMRRVVGALLASIPGLASIALVLLLIYYVFAVIATNLFGDDFPEWFGTIGRSLYTLFQVMTLESWSMGISRPVMEVHPYAWTFFIPFILIATFTMLNLFIAIIVNTMQTFTEQEAEATQQAVVEARDHVEADLHREIQALREELRTLKELLERRS